MSEVGRLLRALAFFRSRFLPCWPRYRRRPLKVFEHSLMPEIVGSQRSAVPAGLYFDCRKTGELIRIALQ